MKKLLSVIMIFAIAMAVGCNAFAAEISTNGGNASTPVNLSTVDSEGHAAATSLSVTIPTSLPVSMGQDGTVVTATNCKIINNSYGAVRVESATIEGKSPWTLTAFGDKSTLASEKVNSNKIGFAMTLGNGTQVKTTSGTNSQALISAPVKGCYMSGVGDSTQNSIAVNYNAIVTPVSVSQTDKEVASIVFVVGFDTVTA